MSRAEMVHDVAVHLSDQVREVFLRNLTMMRDAGFTTTEGIGAVMHAVNQVAFVTVGMTIAGAPEDQRESAASNIMELMDRELRARMPELLGKVDETVDRRRGAAI